MKYIIGEEKSYLLDKFNFLKKRLYFELQENPLQIRNINRFNELSVELDKENPMNDFLIEKYKNIYRYIENFHNYNLTQYFY